MERKPWATIKDVVEGLIREFSPAGRKMLDSYYQGHPGSGEGPVNVATYQEEGHHQ